MTLPRRAARVIRPNWRRRWGIILALAFSGLPPGFVDAEQAPATRPSLEEVLNSEIDLWGEAALREPNGASYEFFEMLLPPPRYVNADFRFYPLVLSAPNAKIKGRLISNGSGVNLHGGARSWNDPGTAVTFRVGPDEFRFGELLDRLEQPTLAHGYLPIPSIRYRHGPDMYCVEAFASTDPALAAQGTIFVKFFLAQGTNGLAAIELEQKPVVFSASRIVGESNRTLVQLDANWTWERQRAHAKIGAKRAATLAIFTQTAPGASPATPNAAGVTYDYAVQRQKCVDTWEQILAAGMNVETPEPLVNNAWKNLIIQNFSLINGDAIRYSAGNQYDALYETEGSDAAVALMLWGHEADMRRLLVPLLDFRREAIKFNQAGHKLEDVARYYWQTRDRASLQALKPKWEKEVNLIVGSLGEHGLVPREHYCNDIPTPVFSLNSNAKCWRGLRDLGTALADAGEPAEAARLAKIASRLRQDIFAAVERSVFTNIQPAFIPIALFGEESPYAPLCATRMGNYWNLMVNFILGFEVLGPGSGYETSMLQYIQHHGGLCMGMERSHPQPTFWTATQGVNPLYGMRYVLTLLRRDEPDRALVSFYGMLAQGFTRNTFVAGEGSTLTPLDQYGRQFYCPPNSAGNGHFLQMLRGLLVQDLDLDDDGNPETLRLLFATPKAWLEDGKVLKVERAPTAFGPVSIRMESKLAQGEVVAEVNLPQRNEAKQVLLRARLPAGWKALSAKADSQELRVDERGTVDISTLKGKTIIHFKVTRL